MKHSSIFVILLMIMVMAAAPAFAVDGFTVTTAPVLSGDTIAMGATIRFTFNLTNDSFGPIEASSNGFRVYEKNGGNFHAITYDTVALNWAAWTYSLFLNPFGIDGVGADTIGFGGFSIFGGVPIGVNQDVWYVESGSDVSGDTLCIDSSYYPPGGAWIWSHSTLGSVAPSWGGPYCFHVEGSSDVDDGSPTLPTEFKLSQNYPNPFNPTTDIAFDVPVRSLVSLTIFNVLGQRVTTLIDRELAPGSYIETWDGTSDGGSAAASGIYFYKIEAGDFVETKKMMLLK